MYIELLNRVSSDFPIEYYYTDTNEKPRFRFPAQWHPDVEMLHILEGNFSVTLNNDSYTLCAGDVLFINPETIHSGTPKNCIYECVVFNPSLLFSETFGCRFFFEGLATCEYFVNEYFPAGSEQALLAEKIFDSIATRTPGYKFRVIGAFYDFFGNIVDKHLYSATTEKDTFKNRDIQRLKSVITYIQANYSAPLTLNQLAETTELSARYFCSFFRRMTGKTPFAYLTEYRITRAAQKLTDSNLSITEIAYSCGFNDLSHFIKTFRQNKGVSPGEYRKKEC